MPIYNAELSDGRIVELESDHEPTEQEVLASVGQYEKERQPGALRSAVEHAVAGLGPGAAFVAASIPGAKYGALAGAMIPGLGETGIGEVGGALLGGLTTGTIGSIIASKAQKAAVEAVAPEFAQRAEESLAYGEREHPWASEAGGLAAFGASARMAPFKLATLPFRLALGTGIGAAVPTVTKSIEEGKLTLPTVPELVGGVAGATLFGEPRFTKPRVPGVRPPPTVTPEVRAEREQILVDQAKAVGRKLEVTDNPLAKPGDIANTLPDGTIRINRRNLHDQLETGTDPRTNISDALDTIVTEESIHGITRTAEGGDAKALEYWNDLTGLERWIERKRYQGKGFSDTEMGHEAIRFALQRAQNMQPGEFVFGDPGDIRTARLLTRLEDVVRWIREKLGTKASQRQLALLDQIQNNLETYKKGAADARSQQEAAEVHGDVRPQPVEGVREVPVQEGGPGVQPQAEGRVEEKAQILLKPQKTREGVLLKNPPVVKDVPPGTIPPDALIPAIRLINGDVVHGWVKKNGKVSQHPEIAKRYGITVEEMDRKGFVDRAGTTFYEREPAAVGTQLPTGKKEGELHSTDLPEQAPRLPSVGDIIEYQEGFPNPKTVRGKVTRLAKNPVPGGEPLIPMVERQGKEIGASEWFSSGKVVQKAKAPPTAPTGEAQPPQARAGAAIPPAAQPVGGPAAKPSISTALSNVQQARLAELTKLLTAKDYTPSMAELQEYGALTAPQRKAALAARAARRAGPPPEAPGTTMPAMPRRGRGEPLTDEEMARIVPDIVMRGASTHTKEELLTMCDRLIDRLSKVNPNDRKRFLLKFQISFKQEINRRVQKMMEQDDPTLVQGKPSAETQRLIAEAKRQGFTGKILVTDIPLHTRQSLEEGIIGHVNRKPEWRKPEPVVDAQGNPLTEEQLLERDWVDTGKVDKQGRKILKPKARPEEPVWVETTWGKRVREPESEARRLLAKVGDYPSFLRAVRSVEKMRAEQTGEVVETPEAFIRELWNQNIPDILNNMSSEQLGELMKAAGSKHIDPRTGQYRTRIAEPDADSIIEALEREYPEPGRPILDPTDPEGKRVITFEDYKKFNNFTDDKEALKAIKLDKDKALSELHQFARTRQIPENKAVDAIYEIQRRELQSVLDLQQAESGKRIGAQGENKYEKTIRESVDQARRNRYRIISYLSEWLMDPARPPAKNPDRLALSPDDIDSARTFTEMQGRNLQVLRSELWPGSQVKGKTVSQLTKGVAVIRNETTKQLHAVSFYLHPTDKEIMVYDPGFIPGDKSQKHIPLEELLGGPWNVRKVIIAESPLHNFHQRWKTEAEFDNDIGWAVKEKESVLDKRWEAIQPKKEEAEPVTEEEVTGEEPSPPETKEEAAEEEARIEKLAEAQRAEYRAEQEGLRPGEAVLLEGFESGVKGERHLAGPGEAELGLLKTDPYRMTVGMLTKEEAEAIANTFSEQEIVAKKIAKTGVAGTTIRPISGAEDIKYLLQRIALRRNRRGWIRGQDYAFRIGIDKMVRTMEAALLRDQTVKLELKKYPPLPKDKPFSEWTNFEKAHWDRLEDLKEEALMRALQHAYDIAQKSRNTPAEIKAGALPINEVAFRTEAMAIYGETARRDIERAAIQEKHAARTESISGERTLLAGSKFGGAPRVRGTVAAHLQQKFPAPAGTEPAKLPGSAIPAIRARAEEEYIPKMYEFGGSVRQHVILPGVREPEPTPAMQRRGKGAVHGVANRLWPNITSSWEHLSQEQLVSMGREQWKSWADTYSMLEMAKEGYGLNLPQDAAVARYGGFLLDQKADQIAKTAGPKSDAYIQAEKDSTAYQQRFHDTFKTATSYTMLSFKGDTDLDTGYTVFRREFKDRTGREPTFKEDEDIQAISAGVEKAKAQSAEVDDRYGEALAAESEGEKLSGPLKAMGDSAKAQSANISQKARENLRRRFPGDEPGTMPAMAMKGGKPTTLNAQDLQDLSAIGSDLMMDLSAQGKMSYKNWKEAMREIPEVGTKFDPYLDQVFKSSQAFRDEFLNRIVGQGDATKPIKNLYSRTQPTVKESLDAIARALDADPKGYRVTQQEAFHTWNIIRQEFVDKGIRDPDEVRVKAAQLIGFGTDRVYPEIRLYKALGTKRTLRKLSQEVISRHRDEARIIGNARNWLKNQQFPGWLQFVRKVPRYFFMDKIFGHGLVPMVTHASNMLFNPYSWRTYFPAWRDMYRMTFGERPFSRHLLGRKDAGLTSEEYHNLRLSELRTGKNFEMWRGVGLQVDPFKYTDDYQIAALQGFFAGKTGGKIKRALERAVAGWGFDALKTLRLARANQWWDLVPDHLKTPRMAELIADSVNHATGIVKTKFPEAANWLLFAPKLEASRWAFLFKDTIRAADYLRRWNTALPEERLWARQEIAQKAVMVGMYFSMLAMSQGLLAALRSDQKINGLPESMGGGGVDPKKPDFLAFKVPGFKIHVASPFIGMIKLFANLIHAGQGELRPTEKLQPRQSIMDTDVGRYVRGKFSPFASFGYDVFSGQDPTGRPLPWSEDVLPRYKRLRGIEQYTWPEWTLESVAPIPGEEFVHEMWSLMGMDDQTANAFLRALRAFPQAAGVAAGMGLTGARITQDEPD